MNPELSGTHRTTFDAIFRHPVAHNLHWSEVRSMLIALSDAVQEHNDVFKITRNGKTLALHRPNRNGRGEVEQLMNIRRFLEQSDAIAPAPSADGLHLLVVIDHRLARVYRTEAQGAVPQRITPYDPLGSGRYLHYVQDDSNGQRKPELKRFYEAISTALRGAESILLLGSGTGASSAMEQLHAELKHHHRDLARRVVGSVVVNETHLTENQLLARAREFYLHAVKDVQYR